MNCIGPTARSKRRSPSSRPESVSRTRARPSWPSRAGPRMALVMVPSVAIARPTPWPDSTRPMPASSCQRRWQPGHAPAARRPPLGRTVGVEHPGRNPALGGRERDGAGRRNGAGRRARSRGGRAGGAGGSRRARRLLPGLAGGGGGRCVGGRRTYRDQRGHIVVVVAGRRVRDRGRGRGGHAGRFPPQDTGTKADGAEQADHREGGEQAGGRPAPDVAPSRMASHVPSCVPTRVTRGMSGAVACGAVGGLPVPAHTEGLPCDDGPVCPVRSTHATPAGPGGRESHLFHLGAASREGVMPETTREPDGSARRIPVPGMRFPRVTILFFRSCGQQRPDVQQQDLP